MKKKRVRLYLQRLIGNLFGGSFASYINSTHGLELDELRQYQTGDDLRSVDWKTTSRIGRLHVRLKLVDKRATIFFIIDKSRSEKFGSFYHTKEDIVAKLLSLLVYAASETGNEIGFLAFTDRVEQYIPPKTGENEAFKNMKKVLTDEPSSHFTDINAALTFLHKKVQSPSLIFILSDFFAPHNYERSLKAISYRHEVIPVIVSDKRESCIPKARGYLTVRDVETYCNKTVSTTEALNVPAPFYTLLRKLAISCITIQTDEDEGIWIKKISEFFDKRIRRGGRIKK